MKFFELLKKIKEYDFEDRLPSQNGYRNQKVCVKIRALVAKHLGSQQ